MKVRNRALAGAIRATLIAAPGLAAPVTYAQQAQESQQPSSQLPDVAVYGKAVHYRPDDQSVATGLKMDIVDAPVSVSVLTDQILKQANAETLYDVADLVPGLNSGGQGYGVSVLRLRGQPVSEARINGINVPAELFTDSYALERVEIVRGPATVLYGVTGAFGGELNQVLKQPKSEYSADVGFSDGNFVGRRFETDVTGAIPGTDDRLKARVVGSYTAYGMFQDFVVPQHNIHQLYSAAITFDATPNTSLSLYSYSEHRHYNPDDGCAAAQDPTTGQLYLQTSIPVEHWSCGNPRQATAKSVNDFAIASVKHKFDNGWYSDLNFAHGHSIRNVTYDFAFGPAGAFGIPPHDILVYSYLINFDRTTTTANASLGGKFDLFNRTHQFFSAIEYQHYDNSRVTYQSFGFGLLDMFKDGGRGILSDGSQIPLIPKPTWYDVQDGDVHALRGSAQLLMNLGDRVDALVGVLAQHTKQDDTKTFFGISTPGTSDSLNRTDFVKRLGVTYGLLSEKTKRLSAAKTYFSYSEGFLPNAGVFSADGTALTAPQRMKSYELGLKTQWNNSNVNADVALYHSTRTNIPSPVIVNVGTGGSFSDVLGGKNTYEGFEFELLGEVLPGWNASLNYTYTHNQQDTLLFSQKLAVAGVPKQTIGFLTSYEFLGGAFRGLVVGTSLIRKIDAPMIDAAQEMYSMHYDPNNQLPESVTIVDFRVAYKGFGDHGKGLELFAHANNAFSARFQFANSNSPGWQGTQMAPRAVTVGANYRF